MRAFEEEWAEIKKYFFSEKHQLEVEEALHHLKEKPFVLYGAGAEGIELAKILQYAKCLPVCFCDGYKTGIEPKTGLKIISPSELLGEYKNVNIIISSLMYMESIKTDLNKIGVSDDSILPRKYIFILIPLIIQDCFKRKNSLRESITNSCFINMAYTVYKSMKRDDTRYFSRYKNTFDMLDDEKSKNIFINYLKFCLFANSLNPDSITTQYFDPVMNYTDAEVFVDCGAYTGDTALLFMEKSNRKYKHYYAFEPDSDNCKKTAELLSSEKNVTIVQKGAWSHNDILRFSSGNTSSSAVSTSGDVTIEVVSIDEYFSNIEQKPTVIKMDIEGAELEALKGAENTIRNYKPKLAICIYHKGEDLYEIPQFIKTCRPDYKFYLRHYTDTSTELVLYTI